nr:hypothetical protein [Tanacetum cinerariifolium]
MKITWVFEEFYKRDFGFYTLDIRAMMDIEQENIWNRSMGVTLELMAKYAFEGRFWVKMIVVKMFTACQSVSNIVKTSLGPVVSCRRIEPESKDGYEQENIWNRSMGVTLELMAKYAFEGRFLVKM